MRKILSGSMLLGMAFSTFGVRALGSDWGAGIAVDAFGDAYVTGVTGSSDFPVVGEMDTIYNGGDYDAFVAKVNVAVAPNRIYLPLILRNP